MTTFAIMAQSTDPQLTAFRGAMKRVFGGAYLEVEPGQFVAVKKDATSQQITNQLGPNGEVGRFIVITSAGHWGWHDKAIWEWLTVMGAT